MAPSLDGVNPAGAFSTPGVDETVTISAAAHQLSARERKVLALRFVHDLTQTQIAEQIGVSQMQVSRILRRALTQLRELTDAPVEAHS